MRRVAAAPFFRSLAPWRDAKTLSQQSEYYQELRTFSFLARETDIGAV